jgi:hypothetical protein
MKSGFGKLTQKEERKESSKGIEEGEIVRKRERIGQRKKLL